MCCYWCEAFCEGSQRGGKTKGKRTELVSGVFEVEMEVPVVTEMNRNVEICILEFYHN